MTSSRVARNGVPPADRRPDSKMANTDDNTPAIPLPIGPHPGVVTVPAQYVFEQNIRQTQKAVGSDPTREDTYRLQGVQMIDNVRQALHLYVLFATPRTGPHPLNFPLLSSSHVRKRAEIRRQY